MMVNSFISNEFINSNLFKAFIEVAGDLAGDLTDGSTGTQKGGWEACVAFYAEFHLVI